MKVSMELNVSVILYTEDKQKIIKDFEIEKIKKIL